MENDASPRVTVSPTPLYNEPFAEALWNDLARLQASHLRELQLARAASLADSPISPWLPSPDPLRCAWCGRSSPPVLNPSLHDPILPSGPPPHLWIHHSCWHRRQHALHLPYQSQPEIIPEP